MVYCAFQNNDYQLRTNIFTIFSVFRPIVTDRSENKNPLSSYSNFEFSVARNRDNRPFFLFLNFLSLKVTENGNLEISFFFPVSHLATIELVVPFFIKILRLWLTCCVSFLSNPCPLISD